MANELLVLTPVAASIALIHTLAGPDHYLPFIAMARAGRWNTAKTVRVTILCGLGHVSSSIILALLGGATLLGAERMARIESIRGDLAAWGLIAFGLLYAVWGLRSAVRNKPHRHEHTHADGVTHHHVHTHAGNHSHVHEKEGGRRLTPWVLFTIFVLGPCEPLIPLLMFPAVKQNPVGFIYVAALFAVVTVGSMLAVVLLALLGMKPLRLRGLERWSHSAAGLAILACGVAIKYLGL
jgi:ABC-type nickel/cobalt efflux system permease component RcnA